MVAKPVTVFSLTQITPNVTLYTVRQCTSTVPQYQSVIIARTIIATEVENCTINTYTKIKISHVNELYITKQIKNKR